MLGVHIGWCASGGAHRERIGHALYFSGCWTSVASEFQQL